MVGGPLEVGELLPPTIGYQVDVRRGARLLEAYGAERRRR